MSVYQSKTRKFIMNNKLVGVHIPNEDAHRIALYCVGKGVTRTKVLKDLINEFLEVIPSLDELVLISANNVIKEWRELVQEKQGQPAWETEAQVKRRWWDYRRELMEELARRKIEAPLINQIIQKTEEQLWQ